MKSSCDNRSIPKSLKADFAAFRSQNRPRARVPDRLRRAVVEAVAAGVDQSVLMSELGITHAQMARWRRRLGQRVASPTRNATPRILEVVPSPPGVTGAHGLRVSYEAGRLLLELSF